MTSRRMNSFQNWCLTGTVASSLILGGSVLSQAGPLRLPGKSTSKAQSQTELQKQIAERKQAEADAELETELQTPITAEESQSKAEQKIAKSSKRVQLNCMEASWKSVIDRYAEQTGMELIAEPGLFPKDRYTRRDRSYYTAEEALKIINRELQKFDLKLVSKAKHLVLMELAAAAPNYRRPELQGDKLVAEHSLRPSTIKPAFPDRNTPKRIEVDTVDERAVPISTESVDLGPQRIQLAGGAEPAAEIAPRSAALVPVTIQHRRTKDIANVLYRAFEKNCEMISDGPDGLPAIRVYEPLVKTAQVAGKMPLAAPKRVLRFTLAIDHANGELLIQAPRPMARAVASMIRKLDVPPVRGASVQLFASEKYDQIETMAELVQTQIAVLAKAQRRAPAIQRAVAYQGDDPQLEAVQPDEPADAQPAEGDAVQQPRDANNPPPPGNKPQLPDLLGGLKGDVTVESVPDLGVMILRGNQKDVDAVMGIIREIEKLSAGTAPDVHLLLLKNSNSESLAELLSQVYERLSTRRQRGTGNQGAAANANNPQVTIIPVVKPNAILIVASEADMESVLKLAEELDQPVDPGAEFQMFRLKSAIAEQVLQT
ncbi:MAG: gspD, partial [Planctomycetaceae bacterium]|nr:gspD [Planctomycetaceae bacterium]